MPSRPARRPSRRAPKARTLLLGSLAALPGAYALDSTPPDLRIGEAKGSNEVLVLSGAKSSVNVDSVIVGENGLGTLQIDSGAVLNFQPNLSNTLNLGLNNGSFGEVTVTGAGSAITGESSKAFWDAAGPRIVIGGDPDVASSGGGRLNIFNGGTVAATSVSLGQLSMLAKGTLNVDGPGSALTSQNSIVIGNGGSAVATFSGGSSVSAPDLIVARGGIADLKIAGAGTTVTTGPSANVFGLDGGVATVTVSSGAAGHGSSTSLFLGSGIAGSKAVMTVTGDGTSWSASDLSLGFTSDVKGGDTNKYNSGSLTISAGATFSVGTVTPGDSKFPTEKGGVDESKFPTGKGGPDDSKSLVGNLVQIGGANGTGSITVDGKGSSLISAGNIAIGAGGSAASQGTLTIANGGFVSAPNVILGIGAASKGNVLDISGAGSQLITQGVVRVGDGGQGSVSLKAGAFVSAAFDIGHGDAGSSGSVTIFGPNATWSKPTSIGSDSNIGYGTGNSGTLVVGSGGTVASVGNDFYVGREGGKGVVIVSGKTASVTHDGGGSFVVGIASNDKGATFTSGKVSLDEGAKVIIGGATVIGQNANAQGSLGLTTGASFTGHGTLTVGLNGGFGTVSVDKSALVAPKIEAGVDGGSGKLTVATGGSVTAGLSLGHGGAGSSGVVSISGAGSTWTKPAGFDGDTLIGSGMANSGSLTVDSGGAFNSTGNNVVVGRDGANGKLWIAGKGSSFSHSGGNVIVGSEGVFEGKSASGYGFLNVSDGAKLSLGETDGLIVGNANNGTGFAQVLNGGTVFAGNVTLGLGAGGNGTLDISNKSRVEASSIAIGSQGGTGVVTVSGGSALVGGSVAVGAFGGGSGTLTVDTGSSAQAGTLDIGSGFTKGESSASQGSVTVDHGSTMVVNFGTTVGGAGTGNGSLTVANLSTFIGGSLDLNSGGLVTIGTGSGLSLSGNYQQYAGQTTLAGGKLTAGELHFAGGSLTGSGTLVGDTFFEGATIAPGFSPGELLVIGNLVMGPANLLEMEIAGLGAGQFDFIHASGSITFGGTLNLSFLNGFSFGAGESVALFEADGGFGGAFASLLFNGAALPAELRTFYDGNRFMLGGAFVPPPSSAVPEPSTYGMIGAAALIGLGLWRRRSRLRLAVTI